MSGNRRKNSPQKPIANTEEPLSARVVAIPKDAEPAAANAAPKAARAKPERIGDRLRQARLDKNDDLYLIAEYLRIKPAFLIALENSQYDEFPADAYIIGFLRTYANFLGIDGKEAVDLYRYEMAGRRKKPVLAMPTPVSEGRTPSGIIMVGAGIAVLLIYALWYGISSANRAEIHTQPALPTVAQPVTGSAVPDAGVAAGLTAPATTATPAASPNAAVIPPPAPGIVVTAEQPKPTASAPVADATPPKDAKTEKEGKKQVYGDANKASRLLIRATQSSWVMVTDESGKAIFDHVLKPGDVYKVPDQPGLSLTTGNGSGIVLSLDGTDLPKVATGAPHVVRNITLDPDRLATEPRPLD